MMPIREQFVHDIKKVYDGYIDTCEDAAPSVVAWELYDPCKVAASDEGSFANRGYHFNSLVMPMWSKPENDSRCRQFARDVSDMFKKEIQNHGHQASGGVEGGAGVRGSKGAVMLYGNYDVSLLSLDMVIVLTGSQQYDEISKDIFGVNYPRLQKLKADYDPNNMFDKLFAIQPDGVSSQL